MKNGDGNPEQADYGGTGLEVSKVNRFLDTVKNRCFKIRDTLLSEDQGVSVTTIKNIYSGKESKVHMVLEIFQEHND
ncbi:hypothetical protein [Flagellimonas flava]|uniref:hypothetical protein n=1 Tax=Flagellimonas flava TaxID=570519 RepID=UPI0009326EF9|nr:hypothetical protein [Allomuricauda flava]